jgi:hypothetical protein
MINNRFNVVYHLLALVLKNLNKIHYEKQNIKILFWV